MLGFLRFFSGLSSGLSVLVSGKIMTCFRVVKKDTAGVGSRGEHCDAWVAGLVWLSSCDVSIGEAQHEFGHTSVKTCGTCVPISILILCFFGILTPFLLKAL